MHFPTIFKVSVISLWGSICLQAISTFILSPHLYLGSDLLSVSLMAMPLAVLAFLAYKTSVGKNWARVSFLILFLVLILPNGLIKSIPFVLGVVTGQLASIEWHYQFASGFIAIALLLQVFSLYVFFSKPSAFLFRQSKP